MALAGDDHRSMVRIHICHPCRMAATMNLTNPTIRNRDRIEECMKDGHSNRDSDLGLECGMKDRCIASMATRDRDGAKEERDGISGLRWQVRPRTDHPCVT